MKYTSSVYFFDEKQQLIRMVTKKYLTKNIQEKEITENKSELMTDKLTVSTIYDKRIESAAYMAVKESDKSFSLYEIQNAGDPHNRNEFVGVNFAVKELEGFVCKDVRPQQRSMKYVAEQLLSYTNGEWRVGYVASNLDNVTDTFYYLSVKECLKKLQTHGCEILFKCKIENRRITDKWIEIYDAIGTTSNKRFTYGSSALSIVKEQDRSQIYTSLIGRGRGEKVGDGYGRRLEFSDVEWKTSDGKPVNKPKGQNWVELPSMTQKYGIPLKNGGMRKREGVVIFEDIEDQSQLLSKTYEVLIEKSRPLVQFKSEVLSGDAIGNTVQVHRYDRGYHYRVRIFKVTIDRLTGRVSSDVGDNLNYVPTKQVTNLQSSVQSLSNSKMNFYESTEIGKFQDDIMRGAGATGGSVYQVNGIEAGLSNSREVYETVYMNGPTIQQSSNFMVENSAGISFKKCEKGEWKTISDVHKGKANTAWTIDSTFYADFIRAGVLRAIDIIGVNITGSTIRGTDIFGSTFETINPNGTKIRLENGIISYFSKEGKEMISVRASDDGAGKSFHIQYKNGDTAELIYINETSTTLKHSKTINLRAPEIVLDGNVDVYRKLTLNGRGEVYAGQGGSGGTGGQASGWNGQYPSGITSDADKFAWQWWVYLIARGFSKAAAAGILGNIRGEAGPSMNPDTEQDGGPAYGGVQMDGSSSPIVGSATYNGREYVQRIMAAAGITDDYRTTKAQSAMIDWCLFNGQWIGQVDPKSAADFKKMTDPSRAAYVFEKNFERPLNSHPEREGYALEWYNRFKDLEITQSNSDIVSVAKSLLGYFTYELIHGEAYIGSVANPDRNGRTDCSGYVWLVLAKAGYRVPGNMQWYTGSMTADARSSHNWFQEIAPDQSKAGDVVIYNVGSGAGANGHTAILLETYRGNDTQIIQMGGDSRKSGVNISTIGYSFGSLLGGDRCIARAVK